MKILIIGSGMYVCGRGTSGHGTILPALHQASKNGGPYEIHCLAQSPHGLDQLREKNSELNSLFSHQLNIQTFSEKEGAQLEVLLKEHDYDGAIVCVPDHLHYSMVQACLEERTHTMVVKPFTTTLKQAKELTELAKNNDCLGMVDFHKRYDLANLKIKDNIENLGELLYAVVNYSQRKSVPLKSFKNWASQTNIFQYLAVHYVDLLGFFTGDRPRRICSLGQGSFLRQEGVEAWDSVVATIEWERGWVSTHHTNWIDPEETSAMSDQRIELVGTKGRVNSDQKKRGLNLVLEGKGVEEINPYFTQDYSSHPNGSFNYFGYGIETYLDFINCLSLLKKGASLSDFSKGQSRPTFEQSVLSSSLVEAQNISLKENGAWVSLENL